MRLNILVDTSVWIDHFNGRSLPHTRLLHIALRDHVPCLCDLTLYEVLSGFKHDSPLKDARNALLRLPLIETGGLELALDAANHYRLLRQRGVTIRSAIDCFIATIAIRSGLPLLANDRDFEPFSRHFGLVLVTSL